MGVLESLYQRNLNIEKRFKHRAVLAILPESCHAPVVTILEGLQELDFKVYVVGKSNVNSWFVNEVISDPRKVDFDFILGAFRWGTRWDHYNTFGLHDCFKVLIDSCDNRGVKTWEEKHNSYRRRFRGPMPPEEILNGVLQPHRWVLPLSGYKPDLVFVSQKVRGVKTQYLPFGIHREYLDLYENKKGKERKVDFAHIPGRGPRRRELEKFLAENRLPGRVFNRNVYGGPVVAKEIKSLAMGNSLDGGRYVSSYSPWILYENYFGVLNNTRVLIFPGVSEKTPWWDAQRPWEAHASGCLVLYKTPTIDMSQYPVLELCKEAVYDAFAELVSKCKYFYQDQERLERLRLETVRKALRYFTPVPLARYFLSIVRNIL